MLQVGGAEEQLPLHVGGQRLQPGRGARLPGRSAARRRRRPVSAAQRSLHREFRFSFKVWSVLWHLG